jgi:non-ribosomal peptide synthetase component E (peptide arylation enzyme)
VTGRVKDVILRGGESVSALDLEAHLLTHPLIWAAAAVPLPDDYPRANHLPASEGAESTRRGN